MTKMVLDDGAIEGLRTAITGDVLAPGDAGYDEARQVFNAMIDQAARRSSPAARHRRRRGGGQLRARARLGRRGPLRRPQRRRAEHLRRRASLIDLAGSSRSTSIPASRTARAGGGVLWGEFDAATQAHGLHTPGGRVTTTGVGGFTLGGGYGWSSSKHGLACDNLSRREVVTADGRVVAASEHENADLFWGIRGGGGNFGIVTSSSSASTRSGPIVLAGLALLAESRRAAEVLRGWRDYVDDAPDELSTACVVLTAPPEEFVPDAAAGARRRSGWRRCTSATPGGRVRDAAAQGPRARRST